MDVKQAVRIAADYVADMETVVSPQRESDNLQILSDMDFAVEGTDFDDGKGEWKIDVGFTRPWDKAKSNPLSGMDPSMQDRRTFKCVTVSDADGSVVSYGS